MANQRYQPYRGYNTNSQSRYSSMQSLPMSDHSMIHSPKIKKCLYSRWVLAILLVILTHYLTVIYYTRSVTVSDNPSQRRYPAAEIHVYADMSEPKKVVFPVNKLYYPEIEDPHEAANKDSEPKSSQLPDPQIPEPAKVEAPKPEEPAVVEAVKEEPELEPPKVEPPKLELPQVELPPKVEPPKAEPPKEEPPKPEPPKVEPPKVEPPKVEPQKEKPADQESPVEESKNIAPPKEEPPKAEPVKQEQAATEPKPAALDKVVSNPPKANIVNESTVKSEDSVISSPAANQAPAPDPNAKKLILAWTGLTSKKPLWGIKPWTFLHCDYANCVISGNRSQLAAADLLIFRIRELKKDMTAQPLRPYVQPIDKNDLPPIHRPDQIWMDINQESPVYTHADEEVAMFNGAFNISSNYLLNSDYSISYIPDVKLKPAGEKSAPVNYAAGKTKMALWFVSHCEASSGRDAYVKELQKYNITVDILGRCSKKSDGCAVGNYTCYREVRQRYKFYLAFENSICNEYITEKFWNTLQSDAYNLPIALGASVKQYEQFSPPNSFLHTRNFTTVKALADYMHKLDKDDVAYNKYHEWRQTHSIVPRQNKESLQCYMCRQANEKKDGSQEYKNIAKYWSRKTNCEIEPEPIRSNEL